MDIATIIGILSCIGLLAASMTMGVGLSAFYDLSSILLVCGGTACATMINYPLRDCLNTVSVLKNAFVTQPTTIGEIITGFTTFSAKARKEGLLSLEQNIKNIDDQFLKKGLQLTVDGLEPQAITEILETEIAFQESRHRLGADIFQTMGNFAPAFGMIGTLIGLIAMLRQLDDPSSIGPSMSLALITTFYGSILANMVFIPIAGKLRARSRHETMVKELVVQGILSLCRGDNPRIIEQKLHAFLPPSARISAFR
ncbi:MotA/TolQ/ExbB proton channel family protein [Deltaproteobacteria bacterium OttesenSCG-928-K17]|nr:MotA/TolQ/ExbB proton channel family protein [Deltaproteobacteria bacterium OttesenSCG-928-K17]